MQIDQIYHNQSIKNMNSSYDEKVEKLFNNILKKIEKKSVLDANDLKMRKTMHLHKSYLQPQGQQTSKSVLSRRYELDNQERNSLELKRSVQKENPQSLFSSTFVNIKNARYQLTPIKEKYKVQNIQFPDFGRKKSVKKHSLSQQRDHNNHENFHLFNRSSSTNKKSNIHIKESWNRYQHMTNLTLMKGKDRKGVFPTSGRRIAMRKMDKTQENIEGWNPSLTFEEDIGLMKFT